MVVQKNPIPRSRQQMNERPSESKSLQHSDTPAGKGDGSTIVKSLKVGFTSQDHDPMRVPIYDKPKFAQYD